MFLESGQHLLDGVFLVGMGCIGFAGLKLQALRIVHILPPVHVPAVQLRPVEHSARLGRGLQGIQSVFLNGAAGVDDQPRREMVGFRLRHEGVDAAFGHRAEGIEELALDGAQALFVLCDQVDTCVAAVAVRPFLPQPDLAEAVAQDAGLVGQSRLYQSFEGVPHAKQVGGAGTSRQC